MKTRIIDSGEATASENMQMDAELLDQLEEPTLHFYEWKNPSATYGYFSSPSLLLLEKGVKSRQLELAKRPTGGGVIFHSFDFAFSFLLPASHPSFSLNTLDNYRTVNQIIARAIHRFLRSEETTSYRSFDPSALHLDDAFHLELLPCEDACSPKKSPNQDFRHFCMAQPTIYDVVCQGRKLAGGAQRRKKRGFLHQASIALLIPPDDFLIDVLPNSEVATAMKMSSFPLLKSSIDTLDFERAKTFLKFILTKEFYS